MQDINLVWILLFSKKISAFYELLRNYFVVVYKLFHPYNLFQKAIQASILFHNILFVQSQV